MSTPRDRSEPRRRLVVSDETDVGRREHNEDSHLVTRRFFAVADGIGGSPHGEVASRMVIDAALVSLDRHATEAPDVITRRVFDAAHERVHAQHSTRYTGMGTTLTTLAFDTSLKTVVVGHTGDSRAYLFRDKQLARLTRDEKMGRFLVGRISTKLHTPPVLSSHIAEIGDVYLLCTDGVTEKLTDDGIAGLLCSRACSFAASKLVTAAIDAGARDNVTAIMVRVNPNMVP